MSKNLQQLEHEFQERIAVLQKGFEEYIEVVHGKLCLDDIGDAGYWRIMARILDGIVRDLQTHGKLQKINGIHPMDEALDDFETCFVDMNDIAYWPKRNQIP